MLEQDSKYARFQFLNVKITLKIEKFTMIPLCTHCIYGITITCAFMLIYCICIAVNQNKLRIMVLQGFYYVIPFKGQSVHTFLV